MKIKILLFTLISLCLGSCTLTKRYHSIGYQVDWKSNKNTTNQVKKNNPITVNKSTTPLLDNKSLGEITNSETELSPITKSDVQQSLPIEKNSIGKSPKAIISIFHKAQPKDSVKIQKIAVLKQKTETRFKTLGISTVLSILLPIIIDILDGKRTSNIGGIFITNRPSVAFIIATMILIFTWFMLLFIATITWMVYLIYKLSYNINH